MSRVAFWISLTLGQLLLLIGLASWFLGGSFWPVAASLLAVAVIHAALAAWTRPVAIPHPAPTPVWRTVVLWLLLLYVLAVLAPLAIDLSG